MAADLLTGLLQGILALELGGALAFVVGLLATVLAHFRVDMVQQMLVPNK